MGPRPASPHPQLPAPPFPGDLPPQGEPSLSSRGSPPPQRLLFSNPGSLHPPASPLPSTFFISPSLASRHLLRAPTLPAQTLLFPQTCLQCRLLPPIPIFHLSHLCSNGGLASASLHLSSPPTRTPASSPGLGRLPPRSMPPEGSRAGLGRRDPAWRLLWAGQRKAAFVVQTGASRGGRLIVHPLADRSVRSRLGKLQPGGERDRGCVCVCWGRVCVWGGGCGLAVIRAGRGPRADLRYRAGRAHGQRSSRPALQPFTAPRRGWASTVC